MVESDLEKQIQDILALPEDFDDEGSPAYKRETVDRAVEYIPRIREFVYDKIKIEIGNPSLWPGPDGSVDLYWKGEDYKILFNVTEEDTNASYCILHNKDEFNGVL